MVKSSKKSRLKIPLAVFVLGALVSLLFLFWVNYSTSAFIRVTEKETAQMVAASNTKIKEIKEQKAAELLRQQKAATAASESARLAGLNIYNGPDVINSKDCNSSTKHNDPNKTDVLVNKRHCLLPLNYEPNDLVSIGSEFIRAVAYNDYIAMFKAAADAGQGFRVTSGYRSYSSQVNTFNHWVSISGMDGADTYSARPGYSEHQTGLVIDVAAGGCVLDCFGTTSQYKWLQENAAKYGFIQRYYVGKESITGYSAEEWHYRYVGVTVATDMKNKGIKTLEEYWGMPGGDYETLPANQ